MSRQHEDMIRLIENPELDMGASYHDAGACWGLINEFRSHTRELLNERRAVKAAFKECVRAMENFHRHGIIHLWIPGHEEQQKRWERIAALSR